MKFYDITDEDYPHPGEYLLYIPSQTIVMCGAFTGTRVKVMHNGRVLEDKVENFKKNKDRDKREKGQIYLKMQSVR